MGPRCSSAETQVCHRSYIIAATINQPKPSNYCRKKLMLVNREIPLKPNVMWLYEVFEYKSGIYTLKSFNQNIGFMGISTDVAFQLISNENYLSILRWKSMCLVLYSVLRLDVFRAQVQQIQIKVVFERKQRYPPPPPPF